MSNNYWRSNTLLRDKGDKIAKQKAKEAKERSPSPVFVLDGIQVDAVMVERIKTGVDAYNHKAEIYSAPTRTKLQKHHLEKAPSQGYLKKDYSPAVIQKAVKTVSEPRLSFARSDEGYDSPRTTEEFVYRNLPRLPTREQLSTSVSSSGYGSPAYTPKTSTRSSPKKEDKNDVAKELFRPVSRRSSLRSVEDLEAPPKSKLNDSVSSQYSFKTQKSNDESY